MHGDIIRVSLSKKPIAAGLSRPQIRTAAATIGGISSVSTAGFIIAEFALIIS